MTNFTLGDKCNKDEIINMTRAWDKENNLIRTQVNDTGK